MMESDLIGAMRHVTPAVILKAARLIAEGKVYTLAHTLEPMMPQMIDCPDIGVGDRLTVKVGAFDIPEAKTRVFSDWVAFETHSGTHIDALSHWSKNCRMYGGLDPNVIYAEAGMKHLGLDEVPPMLTRAVLIDAAAYKGTEILLGGTVLQPEDFRGALKSQGVSLDAGDVVLVRTGWARHWDEPKKYMAECPGLSRRSAEWIADQHCVAIGADQWVVDAVPPERTEDRRACHEVCLVERGLHIIENLNLEELGRDKVYQFLFVALAPPLKGGTGFPAQVLAVI